MARKGKFEEEKNRLDSVRKRLVEAIEDAENEQHSLAGEDEYEKALIFQKFVEVLRVIKVECGELKPKEAT